MDTFLKQLLVERSAEPSLVVVDNARYHTDRWSKLPGRVRFSLLPSKGDPTTQGAKSKRNKKHVGRSLSHSISRTTEDRWSCSTSESPSPRREKLNATTIKSAPLAPPSCPQRQQSIEVTAETLALMSCSDVTCNEAPNFPERKQSVEYSPNTVLDNAGHLPRMPERQTSDAFGGFTCLPPPPMTMESAKKSLPAPQLGFFSSRVKRSEASLLDDDDDSDDDMIGQSLPRPMLIMKNSTL
jgi:hypothetical protein